MELTFREARPDDISEIGRFTENTFSWGDYLLDVLPDWIEDRSGLVLVAEAEGIVVAVGRVGMVSTNEAWAQGARVHPDHRRRGIGTALSERLWEWAAAQGARVVRLAVEDENAAADAQVRSMGFTRLSDWHFATRRIGVGSPVPTGNGGRRVPAPERLRSAHSAEAEPAYFSWSAGELARAARGLFPIGWVWRLMTIDHVALAARNHALWEGRPGWVILESDEARVRVHWMETAEDDARSMVRAIVDIGVSESLDEVGIMAPSVPWLDGALEATGFDLRPLGVYALVL